VFLDAPLAQSELYVKSKYFPFFAKYVIKRVIRKALVWELDYKKEMMPCKIKKQKRK